MNQQSKYNPAIHHRRSIRLKGYDYSRAGLYFITICAQNRQCLFGDIVNDEMMLNEYGLIAHEQWEKIQERFSNIELDVFQIMPNHMHGIVRVEATLAVVPDTTASFDAIESDDAGVSDDAIESDDTGVSDLVASDAVVSDKGARVNRARTTVGDIIGAYKSLVANECLKLFKLKNPNHIMGKLWQRNYYEHIIRDENSYNRIREYIINNPAQWQADKFNPANKKIHE